MKPIAGTVTDPRTDRVQGPTEAQLLILARSLAKVAHAGQRRKGTGEPYYNHLRRVAEAQGSARAKTIAYLHDVIEDTNVRGSTLLNLGFPEDVVADVLVLSRDVHESYADFISRTVRFGSLDALKVKLADLLDNLSDPWAASTTLAKRYLPSWQAVANEIKRRESAARGA